MYLARSRNFRAEKHFPSLAEGGGAGGRNRWAIEEIPEDWVQVKGAEADAWMLALSLDQQVNK